MAGFTLILIVFLQAASPLLGAASMKNINCQITPAVIPVDNTHHRFYPYFVELSRCAGSWGSVDPRITRCSAKQYEEIKLRVVSPSTGQADYVTVLNHTKCGPECVSTPSDCDARVQRWDGLRCRCSCLYKNGPPPEHIIERKEGFRWNKHLCQYVCNKPPKVCATRKVWTRTACGCECDVSAKLSCERQKRVLNSQTCECEESAQGYQEHREFFAYPHSHKLVAVIAVQGAFIAVLIVAVVYFRRKSGNRTLLPCENISVSNRSAERSSEQSA